jgi:viroplasmin and RNaseH domain-containing protein
MSRGPKKNFYAIRKGWQNMTIVTSWEECEPLVSGFSGSEFKGFVTYEEAEEYLDENTQKTHTIQTRNEAGNILL